MSHIDPFGQRRRQRIYIKTCARCRNKFRTTSKLKLYCDIQEPNCKEQEAIERRLAKKNM